MKWSEVLMDKSLQNLPYKIETNEWGQIVMSPASNKHAYFQGKIAATFTYQLPNGKAMTECSIETDKGVKVADVCWCSNDFINKHGFETPYTKAPEICVEILSPSNDKREMDEKRQLYFIQGAIEVWIVSEEGDVEHYNSGGIISHSQYNVQLSF